MASSLSATEGCSLGSATSARASRQGVERRARMRHLSRKRFRRWVLLGGDVLAIGCALIVTLTVSDAAALGDRIVWAAPALLGLPVLFTAYGLYAADSRRISQTTLDELPKLFHALLTGTLLLWLLLAVGPDRPVGAVVMAPFAVAALAAVCIARFISRSLVVRRLAPERVLIVGRERVARTIAHKLRAHPEFGLEPVAVREGEETVVPGADELADIAVRNRIDRIVVTEVPGDPEPLLDLLAASRRLLLDVSVVPSMFEAMGPEIEVGDLEGITVLSLKPPTLSRPAQAIKRGIDVLAAGLTLLLGLPLLILVAVAIKLDSPGPVLFRQKRVGRRGNPFWMLKFRTMVDGAEGLREALVGASQDPHWLKLDSDPRVTRAGRLLRKLSLDELPQLWNVLTGEMSLVGPRPLPVVEDRMVEGWRRGRLDLRPGITGYWQVMGRANISFVEMVKLDYVYVTNWSLWTDVKLMLRTIPAVLAGRGVN